MFIYVHYVCNVWKLAITLRRQAVYTNRYCKKNERCNGRSDRLTLWVPPLGHFQLQSLHIVQGIIPASLLLYWCFYCRFQLCTLGTVAFSIQTHGHTSSVLGFSWPAVSGAMVFHVFFGFVFWIVHQTTCQSKRDHSKYWHLGHVVSRRQI